MVAISDIILTMTTESYGKKIGRKIRAMRQANNWTLEEVAQKLGVGHSWVSTLERGKIDAPGIENVVALAEHFGLTLDELLDFRPPPVPDVIHQLRSEGVPEWSLKILLKIHREGTPEQFNDAVEDLAALWERRRKPRPQEQMGGEPKDGAPQTGARLSIVAEDHSGYSPG